MGLGHGCHPYPEQPGSIQWIRDRLGKLDPRQALCQAISLELSVGHDDLTRVVPGFSAEKHGIC